MAMRPPGHGGDRRTVPNPTRRFRTGEAEEIAAWRESAARARHQPVRRPSLFATALRGLTGVLAGGWVMLALGLIAVQIRAAVLGETGPGSVLLITHALIAVVAVGMQGVADRRKGTGGALAALGVLVLVLGSLWFWWWG